MKLSEVLKEDWPEKREVCEVNSNPAFTFDNNVHFYNEALTSCDREIDREALARVLSEVQSCPNPDCGDKGWYVGETTKREYVTRDMALDAGDKTLEGIVYREAQQEQVQCEFCYTNSLSKFNLDDHIISTMPTRLRKAEGKQYG